MDMPLFLTSDELADLTGIRKGRGGRAREALQANHLRSIGVPFWLNARGEPRVPRAYFEGKAKDERPETRWSPAKAA